MVEAQAVEAQAVEAVEAQATYVRYRRAGVLAGGHARVRACLPAGVLAGRRAWRGVLRAGVLRGGGGVRAGAGFARAGFARVGFLATWWNILELT